MELRSLSFCLVTNLFAFSYANADGFSVQPGTPTVVNSVELKSYVDALSQYQPATPELTERLQKTIQYYQKVHILKTVQKTQYTVDCVPFAEQPALIDTPRLAESLLPQVKTATAANLASLQAMGSHFDFNAATECPVGSVALLRPSKAMLTSAATNKKEAPFSAKQKNRLGDDDGSGYTWEQGMTSDQQIIYIPTTDSDAYFQGPQSQTVTSSNQDDHSIDQFWVTNTTADNETYSVEFGIIASTYFTQDESANTSIFTFASIDNYGSNSCYNVYCPNFVQSPGTPALGSAISDTKADYDFQVNHTTPTGSPSGYYLTLVTYDPSVSNPQKVSTVLGYYADSVFPTGDLPNSFSVGAEVFADSVGDGTTMYGNYVNPYPSYSGAKQIGIYSENNNNFPYSTATEPAPYGLVWKFGQ